MTGNEREPHVPVETLAAYLEGKLSEREANGVNEHVRRCARCDLELRRLERFSSVESDEELARSAEWIYARGKLERAYRERIAPADVKPVSEPAGRRVRFGRRAWLVPAAVAAAAIIVVAQFATKREREPLAPAREVMRGAPAVVYEIALKAPAGDVAGFPSTFSWEPSRKYDGYTLEIFSPSLERVYAADGIAAPSFAAPDSLRKILKPNIIYLWSVKGHKGLERAALSPNGWFRYKP
jgi:hypothetical protein